MPLSGTAVAPTQAQAGEAGDERAQARDPVGIPGAAVPREGARLAGSLGTLGARRRRGGRGRLGRLARRCLRRFGGR